MMIIRSKAPLRIGLVGGGTDVSPYSEQFGGAVLNATINLYAYASIEPMDTGTVIIESIDQGHKLEVKPGERLSDPGDLMLHRGVCRVILEEFTKQPLSFRLITYVDAPPGSGLGSSSTLVVAILGAF